MTLLAKNEEFVCAGCGRLIKKAQKTSRNHCPYCFLSLHVDEKNPGDRLSVCHGRMIPTAYRIANGTIKIHFLCVTCGAEHRNKVAGDDEVGDLDHQILTRKGKYHIDP